MKRLIAMLLVLAAAGGTAGYYDGPEAEAVPTIHVVEAGETLWCICRPIADAEEEDIRDVIARIMMDNDVAIDATIYPGQKLKIRR